MVVGITECPECGDVLELSALSDDRPIASVTRTCPTCSFTLEGIVVFYPDDAFAMVTTFDPTVVDRAKNECSCGADATVGSLHSSGRVQTWCSACLPGYADSVVD